VKANNKITEREKRRRSRFGRKRVEQEAWQGGKERKK
jgi:hypothetical protein